jgi:two-component system chemotaxis response regulator CheY
MAKTAMVVDDVAFVRKTLTEILTAAHYQVVAEAADGQQAIEMYVKHRPDIVTMDVVMPNMSGIDAMRRIIQVDREAKVVIISAMGQESLIMEAINVGAKDYLLKPFTAEDVLKTVERALVGEETVGSRSRESSKLG